MRYPNLLLAGVQKAGTTWLHQTLSGSRHIFGSTPKELKLWGHPGWRGRLHSYRAHFPPEAKPGVRYFMESTPHYFHAPTVLGDIARDIRDTVPDVRVMVILRDPVERYRSAYIHHMRKGRFPFVSEIDEVSDAQIMLSSGYYGEILKHWLSVFPDMIVQPYDRLQADPAGALREIFNALGIDCDLDLARLAPPTHTSEQKRAEAGWPEMPRLSPCARAALRDYYRDDIALLDSLVDFDAGAWLRSGD